MQVSVVNFSNESDADVIHAVRSVGRQLKEDFAPHWHIAAQLRLDGRPGELDPERPREVRGDAVLYIVNEANLEGALGYHYSTELLGLPYGFVFTEIAGAEWTVTFSHEALELVANPHVNRWVPGPHPLDPNRYVFHWHEMCDPVQSDQYEIEGVRVSNFVLPHYFTQGEEEGSRTNFLGLPLRSFGVRAGGYTGVLDPWSDNPDIEYVYGSQAGREAVEGKRRCDARVAAARAKTSSHATIRGSRQLERRGQRIEAMFASAKALRASGGV